jgi:hypothetical protein
MTQQLAFGFIQAIDREQEEDQAIARRIWHLQHELYQLRSMFERYPPASHEWDIMVQGIRLARFVHGDECADCAYGSSDHIPGYLDLEHPGGNVFSKVCIRDFFGKCVEWGIVPKGYPEAEQQIRDSIQRMERRRTSDKV